MTEERVPYGSKDEAGGSHDGPSLESRIKRLEEIVRTLESDEADLDRALALFEEGIAHVREAERILSATETRIEELLGEGARAVTRPLETEDP